MTLRARLYFGLLGTLLLLVSTLSRAHEITPTIIEMEVLPDNSLEMRVDTNLEALMSEIGTEHADTDNAPTAEQYNQLRALPTAELSTKADPFVAKLFNQITLASTDGPVPKSLLSSDLAVIDQPDIDLARQSLVTYRFTVESTSSEITFSWPEAYSDAVVRLSEQGEIKGASWVAAGTQSESINLSRLELKRQGLLDYVKRGFEHILPLGLDHILFVLGLYLLSQRLKDLLWQVTAFTAAHTLTLALAILGLVNIPPYIVEPLIALSIVYVAIENLFKDRVSKSRIGLVFGFGLLHGLGFAGVLREIGLESDSFVESLIAFNIGVELGQLATLVIAHLLVGYWFSSKAFWNRWVRIPLSMGISLLGAVWFVERVFY
ncbi:MULTISPECIES: HupE/UreJ family protein [unclassified Marinobacterium]|uniref:HupE/UreJ family protein n=1 Tax=unclassified Marinobacterium TaxID=2644139 RepID=UPI001568FD3D|nr:MULTISPECIES: HupE/UreJ family protein [unclassified Marinobacterium]NRP26926.1 HupE / UreJ protein [Marinobacterium sp. xm-d-420]NRP57066.1 HupE / UreJ protein [Marinobacterium sp. xm-d-510]NRP97684.1 HupE / UreJ protein [Marinobacterium sp. xm-a-127]